MKVKRVRITGRGRDAEQHQERKKGSLLNAPQISEERQEWEHQRKERRGKSVSGWGAGLVGPSGA